MAGAGRHAAELARFAARRRSLERADREAFVELRARPLRLPRGLELEWLGVAGYRLTYEGASLLIDPYVSRAPASIVLTGRPILPDPRALDRYVRPPGEVAGIIVGHTHFDHAVDAPALVARYGCRAYGSRSLASLLALHGLERRAVVVEPSARHDIGPFRVRFVPSRHSKILLGLAVPFPGELSCGSLSRLSAPLYRCGEVWAFDIEVGGARIYHQGSADLVDDAVSEGPVDLFLAGVAGREFTERYWKRVLRPLRPAAVVPSHFDDFLRPLHAPLRFAPNVRLARVQEEVASVDAGIEVAALPVPGP